MDQVVDQEKLQAEQGNAAQDALSASSDLPDPGFAETGVFTIDNLNECLVYCLENKVEDLILMSGLPWTIMWSGKIRAMGRRPITTVQLNELANRLTGNDSASIQLSSQAQAWDGAYSLRLGRGQTIRFRVCITGCLGADGYPGLEFVIRPAGKIPPTLEDLGVPQLLIDNCTPAAGIVIVTGPTGSGKTTLLDAVVRKLATDPNGKHILTYYAPIENDLNVIPGKTGVISQCEIGRPGHGAHLRSFPEAVSNALRRHPHAVVVGEARDEETIEGAVTLSMTGHATYTTSHTSSVEMTLPRMADSFVDRLRITNALIDNTRLIVHQRLVQTPSGIGRYPIRSILAFPLELRTDLLKLPNVDMLPAALREAQSDPRIGLSLYDDALKAYEGGHIHENEWLAVERELGQLGD